VRLRFLPGCAEPHHPQALALCAILLAPELRAQEPKGVAGLLSDLERVVDAQESDDWFTADESYDELLVDLMPSVCRAAPTARDTALAIAEQRRSRAGDPRKLFEAIGELADEVEAALRAALFRNGRNQSVRIQHGPKSSSVGTKE
jgi:hypothetical protein